VAQGLNSPKPPPIEYKAFEKRLLYLGSGGNFDQLKLRDFIRKRVAPFGAEHPNYWYLSMLSPSERMGDGRRRT
jgi:hypothetical protein